MMMDSSATVGEVQPSARRRALRPVSYIATWVLAAGIVALALKFGMDLRRWCWEITQPIHYTPDIAQGGYRWGQICNGPEGILNVYERMQRQWSGAVARPKNADGTVAPAYQNGWQRWLDYAPLRLGVMTLWARHNDRVFANDNPDDWRADYEFNRPVLLFNTGMELIGAVCAFLLVRMWVIRRAYPRPSVSWTKEWWLRVRGKPVPTLESVPPHMPFKGWTLGMISALLLWFNPAMILSAHGWPTWDMWIVPMYLLAIVLACYNRWMLAGLVIALGVMFKGQQLVGASVFIVWPLLLGNWRAVVWWLAGFVVGIGAVASPWILTIIPADVLAQLQETQRQSSTPWDVPFVAERVWNIKAILWATGVMLASVGAPFVWRIADRRIRIGAFAMLAIVLILPLFVRHDSRAILLIIASLIAFGLAAWCVRHIVARVAFSSTAVASAILLGIVFFNGSTSWWDCGVRFGTQHWRVMVMGITANLPGIMTERFGYPLRGWPEARDGYRGIDNTFLTLTKENTFGIVGTPVDVTTQEFLSAIFVLTMIPCLWAIARHARNNDPRFLVAITAPWLMFYCFPTQIHERYLLYAAGVGMVMIGHSVGMVLLALLLTIATWCMTIGVMLNRGVPEFGQLLAERYPHLFTPEAGATLRRHVRALYPDIGYGILVIALIFLYVCLTRTPKPRALPEV